MENVESQVISCDMECPTYDQIRPAIFNFFKTNQFTDITLSAEGKFIHCHQVVLAAFSPYFEKMFKIRELAVRPLIVFGDILFEDLLGLLRYIYTGKISVLESEMARFIKAGQTLQVKGFETFTDEDSKFVEGNEVSNFSETTPNASKDTQPSDMTTLTTQVKASDDTIENMVTDANHPNGHDLDNGLQLETKSFQDSQSKTTSSGETSNKSLSNEITYVHKQVTILTKEKLSLQTVDQSGSNCQGEDKVVDNVEGSCQPSTAGTSFEQEPESIPIINDTDFTLLHSAPCKFCGEVVEGSSGIEKKLKQHEKRCSKNPKHESGMCVICEKFVGENRLERHFNIKHGVP